METVRKAWTDERLDDLSRRVDRGFDRVDADIREVRVELAAVQRTMVIGFAGLGSGVLASVVATVLAAVLG